MRNFLVFILFLISFKSFSQDMIIMTNGDVLEGKIQEITESAVKYYKKELPDGPLYSIEKSKIFSLKYENGYIEMLDNKNSTEKLEELDTEEGIFKDPRDGKEYKFKKIGEMYWFIENLRYKMPNSMCYDQNESTCKELGQYYSWGDAIRACPDGWHLATDQDWIMLEVFAGMAKYEATKKGWRGTPPGQASKLLVGGKTGINLQFAGYVTNRDKSKYLGEEAFYWTSSADKSYCAWMRHFKARASIEREEMTLTYKLPVRCVKDK